MNKKQKAERILEYLHDKDITYSLYKPHYIIFHYKGHSFNILSDRICEGYETLAKKIIDAGFKHKVASEIVKRTEEFEAKRQARDKEFFDGLANMLESEETLFLILKKIYFKLFNLKFSINNDSDKNILFSEIKQQYLKDKTYIKELLSDPIAFSVIEKKFLKDTFN